MTIVRAAVEANANVFLITIGLHQGSRLSPYLFALAMDELSSHIKNEILKCMLFVDDIVMVDEVGKGLTIDWMFEGSTRVRRFRN